MGRAQGCFVVLAALATASCTTLHPGASDDRAVLSIGAGGMPEIRYALAPGESGIAFAQHEQTAAFARTHFWSFDSRCFALEHDTLRRLDPSCGDAVVRLDWDGMQRPRMYPGLVRLHNGGLLVFTGYLQPLTADRERLAPWRALAPSGGIVQYLDQKSAAAIVLDGGRFPHDPSGWVYMGPDRLVTHPVAQVLIDDGISPRIADEMLRVAPRLLEIYEDRLGMALPARPIFYLTWINREVPGRSFQADVVPGPVVKFTLTGNHWKDPSAESIERFQAVEAHELAHFWNRSATQTTPWVIEGGAEILSWAAMHAAGLLDDRALADRVDAAYDECAILAGSDAWHAIDGRDQGRYPYACGAVMQLAAIALVRRGDPRTDAFSLWKTMPAGAAASDEKSMRAVLHRMSADGAPVFDALLDSDRSLLASLHEIFRANGVSTQTVTLGNDGPMVRLAVANRTFSALMSADCGGNAAWRSSEHELVTLALDHCRSFRAEMRIEAVEGAPILAHPIEALRRAHGACDGAHRVRVTLEDGTELQVACDVSTPLPRMGGLRHFDPAQIARLVDGAASPGMR